MSQYSRELNVALRAVHLASLLTKQHLLTYQSTTKRVDESTKADASEVTVADFAAQAILISIIHNVFPEDCFIAEESSDMLRTDEGLLERVWELVLTASELLKTSEASWAEDSVDVKLSSSKEEMVSIIDLGQAGGDGKPRTSNKRTWTLDPIDGTKTYIRGQQYAVCLCLIDEGEQRIGVLGCPNLNIDQRSEKGRVMIAETIVDLKPDGGWILSTVKGHGTYLSQMNTPVVRQKLEDVVGTIDVAQMQPVNTTETHPDVTLGFTDSSASPHVSKDLHNRIFAHFAPSGSSKSNTRQGSSPAVPEGSPSLALDIWSQQLKYVLLTLRAEGADAMVRTPPYSTYHAAVWDHAGGQLLLTESGGALTDARGEAFRVDGTMRKLEVNWGICAVRGGTHVGRSGETLDIKAVHNVLFAKVNEEVDNRRKARLEKGEKD